MNEELARIQGLVLAVHPTSRGYGWVLFEGPLSPVDWGIASAKPGRIARSGAHFKRLITRYQPAVVVLEDFEEKSAKRSKAVQNLCREMLHLAASSGALTQTYPRYVIQSFFGHDRAATRHEIAQAIAAQIDDFSHRLPKKRKIWESEDARQSLFDAAALAIVHFAKQAEPTPRGYSGASE